VKVREVDIDGELRVSGHKHSPVPRSAIVPLKKSAYHSCSTSVLTSGQSTQLLTISRQEQRSRSYLLLVFRFRAGVEFELHRGHDTSARIGATRLRSVLVCQSANSPRTSPWLQAARCRQP